MKRGRVSLVLFSLVLILSLSLVSAGWFSDFFGRATGKVVLSPPTGDVINEVWEGATASVSCPTGSNITDIKAFYYCPDDAQNRSAYCSAVSGVGYQSSTFTFTNSNCGGDPCVYTRKKGILAATCSASSTTVTCIDSDEGKDYYVKGSTTDTYLGTPNTGTDTCFLGSNSVSSCSGTDCTLFETFCDIDSFSGNPYGNLIGYSCPNGCSDGACLNVTTTPTTVTCTDSDGGKSYNVAGQIVGNIGSAYPAGNMTYSDSCLDNQTLVERYCSSDPSVFTQQYTCPNGCSDGACLNATSVANAVANVTVDCPDFDGDGVVNDGDKEMFSAQFEKQVTAANRVYDLDGDGKIDLNDFVLFGRGYGKRCGASGNVGAPLTKPAVGSGTGSSSGGSGGNATETGSLACENSCTLDEDCVPLGYRTKTTYCDLGYTFSAQKISGDQCLNSFECDSNFCSSGQCVDAGLIQRMINWFKKIFGG